MCTLFFSLFSCIFRLFYLLRIAFFLQYQTSYKNGCRIFCVMQKCAFTYCTRSFHFSKKKNCKPPYGGHLHGKVDLFFFKHLFLSFFERNDESDGVRNRGIFIFQGGFFLFMKLISILFLNMMANHEVSSVLFHIFFFFFFFFLQQTKKIGCI